MADPRSLREVRAVLAEHREELMRRFSAAGVGIGRPDPGGSYVITVYVTDPAHARVAPDPIDGVPVRCLPAGPFHAQNG